MSGPFFVRRSRDTGRKQGQDKPGDWLEVCVFGFDDKHQPVKGIARIITAFGGSVGSREEAKRLCNLLNNAYYDFHNGVVPK